MLRELLSVSPVVRYGISRAASRASNFEQPEQAAKIMTIWCIDLNVHVSAVNNFLKELQMVIHENRALAESLGQAIDIFFQTESPLSQRFKQTLATVAEVNDCFSLGRHRSCDSSLTFVKRCLQWLQRRMET